MSRGFSISRLLSIAGGPLGVRLAKPCSDNFDPPDLSCWRERGRCGGKDEIGIIRGRIGGEGSRPHSLVRCKPDLPPDSASSSLVLKYPGLSIDWRRLRSPSTLLYCSLDTYPGFPSTDELIGGPLLMRTRGSRIPQNCYVMTPSCRQWDARGGIDGPIFHSASHHSLLRRGVLGGRDLLVCQCDRSGGETGRPGRRQVHATPRSAGADGRVALGGGGPLGSLWSSALLANVRSLEWRLDY